MRCATSAPGIAVEIFVEDNVVVEVRVLLEFWVEGVHGPCSRSILQKNAGQAPREDQLNRAPEQNRTTGQAPREDRTNRSSEQNRQEQEQERIDRPQENRTTTGQGAAGTRANINLTPEKRTRIHEVIVGERNAPRVSSPKFDVSVGARVPRTVRFAALPRTIVEIEPTWRGYEYFMVGDQIVIVDPRSMEIVAVLEA